jgi:hypothetical protein
MRPRSDNIADRNIVICVLAPPIQNLKSTFLSWLFIGQDPIIEAYRGGEGQASMDQSFLRRATTTDSDRVLEHLTQQQHLHPHNSVAAVLQRAEQELGICPLAMQRAVEWLQLDITRVIGRLGRTELTQLARSLHRHWRQSVPSAAPTTQTI